MNKFYHTVIKWHDGYMPEGKYNETVYSSSIEGNKSFEELLSNQGFGENTDAEYSVLEKHEFDTYDELMNFMHERRNMQRNNSVENISKSVQDDNSANKYYHAVIKWHDEFVPEGKYNENEYKTDGFYDKTGNKSFEEFLSSHGFGEGKNMNYSVVEKHEFDTKEDFNSFLDKRHKDRMKLIESCMQKGNSMISQAGNQNQSKFTMSM